MAIEVIIPTGWYVPPAEVGAPERVVQRDGYRLHCAFLKGSSEDILAALERYLCEFCGEGLRAPEVGHDVSVRVVVDLAAVRPTLQEAAHAVAVKILALRAPHEAAMNYFAPAFVRDGPDYPGDYDPPGVR
jgi:hypothetical protein